MEIERKYLLDRPAFDLSQYKKVEIEQGYISENPVIRIRKWDNDYVLTIKGNTIGHGDSALAREEFEIALDYEQFQRLQKKVETKFIRKSRYIIPLESNLTAELDVYYGELSGLYTVEVEFDDVEAAKNFVPPDWFGRDVSFDARYRNNKLSRYGIPRD